MLERMDDQVHSSRGGMKWTPLMIWDVIGMIGATSYSDDEQQTHDQNVDSGSMTFDSSAPQSTASAVGTVPDIIAMDLLDTIEQDNMEQDLINSLVSIEKQPAVSTIMTSENPTTETTNMQKETPAATANDRTTEESDAPQMEVSKASDELSPSEPEVSSDDENHENQSPNKSHKRKYPRSGIKLQRNPKKHAATELKFKSFQIKWEKISDNLLIKLQELQQFKNTTSDKPVPRSLRFSKPDMTSLLNEIVNQLRLIDCQIRAETMENVAKQIVLKYPCLDFCDDDGFGGGQGYVEMKFKMINRNNYLNKFTDEDTPKPSLTLKKRRNVRAGTDKKYWERNSKECSKELFSKLQRDEPDLLTDDVLEQSQSFVRFTLNGQDELNRIVTQLPVLRRRQLLSFHFKKATGVEIESMRNYFLSKREKIIDYSQTCRKQIKLKETDDNVKLFEFLSSLVGEQFENFLIKKEIGTRIQDVVFDGPGPVLVAIDIGGGKVIYYVFAEGARLSEGTTDIITAIQDAMTVHFVYNFMYLKSASKFLELIQEYFLKIITLSGSKSNAVRVGQRQRVVKKVIAALSNHQIPQAGPSNV